MTQTQDPFLESLVSALDVSREDIESELECPLPDSLDMIQAVYIKHAMSQGGRSTRAKLPRASLASLDRYALHRVLGARSFMKSLVYEDSWLTVLRKADEGNTRALRDWAMYFHNYIPAGMLGDPEEWMERG